MIKYIPSEFYIRQKSINWITGIFILCILLFSRFIPVHFQHITNIVIPIILIVLALFTLFCFIYKIDSYWGIQTDIENLNNEKAEKHRFGDVFDKEYELEFLKKIYEDVRCKYKFVYLLKTRKEFGYGLEVKNIFFLLALLYFIGSYFVNYILVIRGLINLLDTIIKPGIGIILILVFVLSCLIACFKWMQLLFLVVMGSLKWIINHFKKIINNNQKQNEKTKF